MKKNWIFLRRDPGRLKKLWLMSRLTLICLFVGIIQLHARSQSVTLNMKDATLKQVIWAIEHQTNFIFMYSKDDLDRSKKISVDLKDENVEKILQKCLQGTGLTYVIQDEVIVLRPRSTQQLPGKIELRGQVSDKQGTVLPGVTILLKGTTIGVVTDAEGNFKFEVPEMQGVVLVFSFIGMKKKEVVYRGEKELKVVLEEEPVEIEEVVVTGIFNKAKESYTGAVTTITSEELKKFGNRSVISQIRNIDPGFNIIEDNTIGSDPNRMPRITVRGNSSLNVDVRDLQTESQNKQITNQPLFIMDGFEITLERMMDLDDNQIESITLLKDASATAMYGTRGANGVVVIVTKKPEPGRLQITYKGSMNIEVPDLASYHLMNAREKLAYEKAAGLYESGLANEEQELIELYNQRLTDVERGVDTYWIKYPVRAGIGHRHSLRLDGGSEVFRYAAGLFYNHVAGAMKGSERNTFNGNVFLSYKYKNVTFQNDLQVSFNKAIESPYGYFGDYAKINAYWKPYDDEGNLLKKVENERYYASLFRNNTDVYNPLWNALLPSINERKYTQIQNNFAIEWNILPELFVRARIGVMAQTSRSDKYLSAKHSKFDHYVGDDYGRRGTYTYGTGELFNYETDFTLNYSKMLADKHQIYAGAGFNFAQDKSENYEIAAEGISNVNMDFLGMAALYEQGGRPYGTEGFSRRMGGILNVNYTYDRRYFIDFSGKMEGSSKFGSESRYAPFWSTGVGWNLHHESFMGKDNILNTARLRMSYGTSGSQDFRPYQAMTTFKDYGNSTYMGWNGVYMLAMGNPDLGWQTTRQVNFGLEVKMWQGRVHLNADYYNKTTDDLLSDITIPSSGGFDSYKANVGKVVNRGVELRLNVYIFRNTEKDLFWSVGGSLAHNKNEIKAISNTLQFLNETMLKEDKANPSFLYKEGQSMNTIFAVPSLGIDPSNGKEIYVKQNGELTYTWAAEDKVPCGVAEPKIWGNLNTMLRYKGLTFNAVFGYRHGGQQYNETLISKVENIYPYENADKRAYYDRWKTPGEHALYKGVKDFSATQASSRFVMDENTLECRSVSLGYEWEADWLKRNLSVSYLSITGYMEDVFRISTIKQERGLSYPFSRKFSVSLLVRF